MISGITAALAARGLNVHAVAGGREFSAILPGCRSVLVFGSGGRALWDALLEDLRRNPEHLRNELHPLDAFVRREIESVDPHPGPSRRWIRCAADEPIFVDFRPLAMAAGLGWTSRLGLVLNPDYGPWLGLRAACFTTESLDPAPPLPAPGPCEDCDAPCESVCPVAAPTRRGWDVARCAAYHRESDDCLRGCFSRRACPIGAEHAHSPLEQHYHSDRVRGRRALGAALGIDSGGDGISPPWERWG